MPIGRKPHGPVKAFVHMLRGAWAGRDGVPYARSGHNPDDVSVYPRKKRIGDMSATTAADIASEGRIIAARKEKREKLRQMLMDPNVPPEQRQAAEIELRTFTGRDLRGRRREKGLFESIIDFLFPRKPRYADHKPELAFEQ